MPLGMPAHACSDHGSVRRTDCDLSQTLDEDATRGILPQREWLLGSEAAAEEVGAAAGRGASEEIVST